MSFDYIDARNAASSLITEFGQTAILEQPYITNGPDYDPTQAGWPTEIAVTVVDLNTKVRDAAGLVVTTRRVLYMKVPAVAPQTDWRVRIGTKWHRILEVRPLAPGGIDVMFEVDIET